MQILCKFSKYTLQCYNACLAYGNPVCAGESAKSPTQGCKHTTRATWHYWGYAVSLQNAFYHHDVGASRLRNVVRQMRQRASSVVRVVGHECTRGQQSQIMPDAMSLRMFPRISSYAISERIERLDRFLIELDSYSF